MPDNNLIKLGRNILSYRHSPEDPRESWQCAIRIHARTKDGDEEFTVLTVDDGGFVGDSTVKYEEDPVLSCGMSSFWSSLIV